MEKLIEGTYYYINGGKRLLYWDNNEWFKPVRDSRKTYSGLLSKLDIQPTVRSVIEIENIEEK